MSTKPTILCIDDELNILALLQFNLESAGYAVVTATTGADGIAAANGRPSLILLDLMLPDMDGTEVCKRLKADPVTASIPIIMITAKDSEMDKILGLELGADDYITKPFSVREVVARVKALLRRCKSPNDADGRIVVGPLMIDSDNYEAFRNGEKQQLTLKEFELLKMMASNVGKVLTRDYLLDQIWGYEFYGETRTVDVHIRHLRQKLGDDAYLVETVRGVGYKMVKPAN